MARPTLHHYTTPSKLDAILKEGLKPESRLPGTNQRVTFAFLDKAPFAWARDDHGFLTGLNALHCIEQEEANGLVRITFEAPKDTYVYDRDLIEAGDTSRYLWSCKRIDQEHRAKLPEAAVSQTIKPYDLSIEERFDHEAFHALLQDYELF